MTLKNRVLFRRQQRRRVYSLYDQLREGERMRDLIVLKGGPGVGKSTFMRCIANQAEEKGLQIEYIRCSGDPDSLDAVWLPQLGTAVVDGTAPRGRAGYPAAVGRYVNLGQFYNVDRLKERRREIVACTNGYQAEYRKLMPACMPVVQCVRRWRAVPGQDLIMKSCAADLKYLAAGRGKKKRGIGRAAASFPGA